MTVPSLWQAIILAAAAYRIWNLLAFDDVADPLRRYVYRMGDWRTEGDEIPDEYRESWAKFVECPRCFGFWVGVAVWGCFQLTPFWTLVFAVPFVINLAVIVTRGKLDPPED